MKSFAIALSLIFIIFIIGGNALSSSNILINEKMESYQACVRIRNKAPNLNLRCEKLIENIPELVKTAKNVDSSNNGVKMLSNDEAFTRKVNKSEEIKLRNLIEKLANENKLRKD